MTPEAKLADFARRVHLQDDDVDYLLSLLQEAHGLGLLAGAAAEREACAKIADAHALDSFWLGPPELGLEDRAKTIADAIRRRDNA